MKKLFISLIAILLAVGLVGAGAFAYFNDTETSTGNTFTAGTLDLKVDGGDVIVPVTVDKIAPGWIGGGWAYIWVLKNTGSIPGQPWVEFSPIINYENDCVEPELNDSTKPDTSCGAEDGELGQYLRCRLGQQDIGSLGSTGGYSYDDKGVLNNLVPGWCYGKPPEGGRHVVTKARIGSGGRMYFPELGQDEEVVFLMFIWLPPGTGNIVQSDSVEFDMTFKLEQVP